jgi:hypothetical protein
LDYKNTIDRLTVACRWKAETTDDWVCRGEAACGDLLERAGAALKEAEEREEAEAKIRIMETQCEELVNLTMQAGKQIPAEAEAEVLEELEEEMDHREGMVEALGQALKDAVPESLKDRVEEVMKETVAVAAKGRRYVDHVRARLDFSKDSESSSSRAAAGAAPGGWRTVAEELGEELEEGPGEEDGEQEGAAAGPATGGGPAEGATGAGGGHRSWRDRSQIPGGVHEELRADAGQRQRMAHIRRTVRELPPLQEGVGGLPTDVPHRGGRRPHGKDSQGQVPPRGCAPDGEPPRRPLRDVGDARYLL